MISDDHATVNRSVSDVRIKVKPSLHQAFSKVVDVVNLCFMYVLLYNTPDK